MQDNYLLEIKYLYGFLYAVWKHRFGSENPLGNEQDFSLQSGDADERIPLWGLPMLKSITGQQRWQ